MKEDHNDPSFVEMGTVRQNYHYAHIRIADDTRERYAGFYRSMYSCMDRCYVLVPKRQQCLPTASHGTNSLFVSSCLQAAGLLKLLSGFVEVQGNLHCLGRRSAVDHTFSPFARTPNEG